MTVKDLREKLAKFPDELPVLVDGFECEYYDEARRPELVWVSKLDESDSWEGDYEESSTNSTVAIVISR